MNKKNLLILVRHGLSEWNKRNVFTGWFDPSITEEGLDGARLAGKWLKGAAIALDVAFQSDLVRTQETLQGVLQGMGIAQNGLPVTTAWQIKERDYGDLSQKNKDEIRKKYGEEQFLKWRRSFEGRPPAGESLKDTVDRVNPYFNKEILPLAGQGKNVLVSAHGNSIRAMIMELDNLSGEKIATVEIPWTIPLIYQIGPGESVIGRYTLGYTGEIAKKFPYFGESYKEIQLPVTY